MDNIRLEQTMVRYQQSFGDLPKGLVQILFDGHWEDESFAHSYKVRLRMFGHTLEYRGNFLDDVIHKVEYAYYTFLVSQEKKELTKMEDQVQQFKEDCKDLRVDIKCLRELRGVLKDEL